jgi:hypothetical protein
MRKFHYPLIIILYSVGIALKAILLTRGVLAELRQDAR